MSATATLERLGSIELPEHRAAGGFDHAAVSAATGLLYVAHTANDAIDVIDTRAGRFVGSILRLTGVAGALVAEDAGLVFTSNRGEDTVGWFTTGTIPTTDGEIARVSVGRRPNGLAFDPGRGLLLAANVGDSKTPGLASVSIVSVAERKEIARVQMPGRTRWTVFDPERRVFFVNVADPPIVAIVDPSEPAAFTPFAVPAAGPHGLDLDVTRRRLYVACDAGRFVCLDADGGAVLGECALGGGPDVIFLNEARGRVYVAIGEPGVIDVIDAASCARIDTVVTEPGAHTMGFDAASDTIYAFLPQSHRALVLRDRAA
jgi:DNA-binding beta-propeller fold protein YncE